MRARDHGCRGPALHTLIEGRLGRRAFLKKRLPSSGGGSDLDNRVRCLETRVGCFINLCRDRKGQRRAATSATRISSHRHTALGRPGADGRTRVRSAGAISERSEAPVRVQQRLCRLPGVTGGLGGFLARSVMCQSRIHPRFTDVCHPGPADPGAYRDRNGGARALGCRGGAHRGPLAGGGGRHVLATHLRRQPSADGGPGRRSSPLANRG